MNILVIGGGGREHAMVNAFAGSASSDKIYCAPGNPGIFELAEKADINISDFDQIVKFCLANNIDFVAVGPEQPLADGISDKLVEAGIKVFGPKKYPAQLESSKGFAKEFMDAHNIPTAKFECFDKNQNKDIHSCIDNLEIPIVLKADGLAGGKGVVIAETLKQAHETADSMFAGQFKEAGNKIVIEEFLKGEEASILAICDGKDFVTLASSQDHKRAYDNDEGPNTGGMGTYAPAPIVTDEVLERVKKTIIQPVLDGMAADGHPFSGCLYAGLMIDKGMPSVVEFNVRFGDPETQSVLSIFEGDFAELLYSAACGKINKDAIADKVSDSACCVIMSSKGYPVSNEIGFEISGIEEAEKLGGTVFHSGTKSDNDKLLSAGGRVLGVTGRGKDLKKAIDNAYSMVDKIDFGNKFYRKDIGAKGLK
ncbi:MAG: phosphoribosylamine--glycine ligase [Candidatus Kapabacteria bacterium]|jgi:phosphoribosylamine--glycine ligase|nr:phosphoribosylamine--glycine ligase [Candidatus Kapabacteria bacterium]